MFWYEKQMDRKVIRRLIRERKRCIEQFASSGILEWAESQRLFTQTLLDDDSRHALCQTDDKPSKEWVH